jgi:hypothetical protein
LVKDIERAEKNRLYKRRMYLTELYNPDDISVESKDLAYIAGLFDGEVALHIGSKGRSYGLRISYVKTNYDILKYIADIFGGTLTQVKPQPYNKPVSLERRAIGAHYMAQLQAYQSKPGSGQRSQLSHMEIKQRRIISTPPRYTKEIVKPKNYFFPDVSMPELNLAYIAGLLDAESSFIIYKISNRPSYLLEVNYRKTDRNTLQYLADIFGGRVRLASHSTENTLDVWLWKLVSADAYSLIKHIYPFLRVKRRAAEICMEFFELYWQWGSTEPVSPERQAIGAKYATMLRLYHTKSVPHRRKETED